MANLINFILLIRLLYYIVAQKGTNYSLSCRQTVLNTTHPSTSKNYTPVFILHMGDFISIRSFTKFLQACLQLTRNNFLEKVFYSNKLARRLWKHLTLSF